MIEFRNISKKYDEKIIIENFNLKIENGEFITIIGSSGSGKTTILKMINALIESTNGDIFVNDININECDLIKLRRSIGYAVQGNILFPHMSVAENISYVSSLSGNNIDDKIVEEWLEKVGLDTSYKNRFPNELSGGEQQRVGIARALSFKPEIVLMDEPFGAVDEITRKGLQKCIKEIHKKLDITILFVTHDIKEAIELGTKVLVMCNGKIEQFDSPENLINQPKTQYVKELLKN